MRNPAGKRKKILRFALNDNSIVNGQLLIVMRGYPNANFANGANERNSIVNGQWLMVMRGTRRIMYPENNN